MVAARCSSARRTLRAPRGGGGGEKGSASLETAGWGRRVPCSAVPSQARVAQPISAAGITPAAHHRRLTACTVAERESEEAHFHAPTPMQAASKAARKRRDSSLGVEDSSVTTGEGGMRSRAKACAAEGGALPMPRASARAAYRVPARMEARVRDVGALRGSSARARAARVARSSAQAASAWSSGRAGRLVRQVPVARAGRARGAR